MKFFLLFASLLILSSCKINGTLQGLVSNYKKTKNENPNLLVKLNDSSNVCMSLTQNNNSVLIINGKQLKQCLSENKKALLYIWEPKCKSKFCYDLNTLQKRCDEAGFELYIIAEYYDSPLMGKKYELKRPILGIDTKYYHSNMTAKYTSRFFSDLMAEEEKSDKRLIYFEKGFFVKSVALFDELL